MNEWDDAKDVDRALAALRRRLLTPESRGMLVAPEGARYDAATRLMVKIDEAFSSVNRSRDEDEAMRLLALLAVVRERRTWRHSPHPCKHCGAVNVRVQTDDVHNDITVWCYACDRRDRVDGADS